MQKKFIHHAINMMLLIVCFLCGGCSGETRHEENKNWVASNNKLKVFCTIAMIEVLVKEIGGEHIDTWTLISGQMDPHSYQLVKGDDEKLASADLIFYNGLGLEHGPSLHHFLTTHPKAVGLGNLIQDEYPDLFLHYDGTVDPHIWTDISLWTKTIKYIVQKLNEYDPVHASEYIERGNRLSNQLLELHRDLVAKMEQVPAEKRFLVTSHDAFNYFTRAYLATENERNYGGWQKRFVAPEGLSPESQLSTADIRNTLEHMKKYHISVIFSETNVSLASIKKLVNAGKQMHINVKIAPESLYGDAMGPKGSSGDSYPSMITYDVETIIKYIE